MDTITININVSDLAQTLLRMESKLDQILTSESTMSQQLDALKEQVKKVTDATQSVVVFVKGLADQIQSSKDDPAALQALSDELRTDAQSLGNVVTENTSASGGGSTAAGGTPPPPPSPAIGSPTGATGPTQPVPASVPLGSPQTPEQAPGGEATTGPAPEDSQQPGQQAKPSHQRKKS